MKKFLALVVPLVFALTACSDEEGDTTDSAPTFEAPDLPLSSFDNTSRTPEGYSKENDPYLRFLSHYREYTGDLVMQDKDLIEHGEEICLFLAGGSTIEDYFMIVVSGENYDPNLMQDKFASLAVGATLYLCPEHS